MTAAATSLLRGPGRRRNALPAAPLDPARLPIDGRSLPQLLAMAPAFARLLTFTDLNGKERGDWTPFFEHEMLFLLAEVATAGEAGAEALAAFDARLAQAGRSAEARLDAELVEQVFALARTLTGWLRRAERIDEARLPARGGELTPTLGAAIEHDLAPRLRDALGPVAAIGALGSPWQAASKAAPTAAVTPDRLTLVKLLRGFADAMRRLAELACTYLDDEIANRSDHAPHASLYVAFIQMQQVLQEDLNGFGARHLDYFYKTVLQLAERAATADQVDVMFELIPHFDDSLVLPAGTMLTAGRDADGADVLYATTAALTIDQTKVAQVSTMFLQHGRGGDWVERIYAVRHADSADGDGKAPLAAPEEGWATFGALPANHTEAAARMAGFGMLIGSPVLLLAGGTRRVTVRLELDVDGFDGVRAHFAKVVEKHSTLTPTAALEAGSTVFVSGAAGWMPVTAFTFALEEPVPGEAPALTLAFTLDASVPAVVANAALFPAVTCRWPLLKLMQNPQAPVCLYSFIARLQVRAAQIAAEVSDLPGLAIEGAVGPVAAAKPFAPFGALPQCGLGFQVGHPELAVKTLEHLSVSLAWGDLLHGAPSLAAYYAGYPMPFDDTLFQVRAEVCEAGRWQALAGGAALPLFANGYRRSDFSWDLAPGAAGEPAPPAVAAGTVRMTLAGPAYAFGQAQYPAIFADVAIKNTAALLQAATAKDAQKPTILPMVAAPLAPMVTAVSLGYRAIDRLNLEDGAAGRDSDGACCFHLTPFGYCDRPADLGALMRAEASDEGHLYVGLAGPRAPTALTLYFELREPGVAQVELPRRGGAAAAPRWRYLAGKVWRDFPEHGVVSHTDGFTRSGTVELLIPPDISQQHTLMPDGLFWISAQVRSGAALLCRTVSIIPHAVRAERCAPVARPGVPAVLPPGTIAALAKKIAPVAKVLQPFASFGGRGAESSHDFRVRVSERLRHKQRASQPADFEALVLELFPAVRQVKCSTANNSRDYPRHPPGRAGQPPPRIDPGSVVITVAATRPVDGCAMLVPLPRYLLDDVGSTLRAHASPFINRLTVRNPVLEGVMVHVTVSLKPGHGQSDASGRLNRAICDFIAPWRSDDARLIDLGSRTLYGWEVLQMIQNQPYVDRVGPLSMLHRIGPGRRQLRWIDEGGCIAPSSPWTVLVPYSQHEIRIGDPDLTMSGIGSMTVGADFRVETLQD